MLFFKNKQQIARTPFHGSIPDKRSSLKMIPEFILLHTGRSRNLPSGGEELITRCLGPQPLTDGAFEASRHDSNVPTTSTQSSRMDRQSTTHFPERNSSKGMF